MTKSSQKVSGESVGARKECKRRKNVKWKSRVMVATKHNPCIPLVNGEELTSETEWSQGWRSVQKAQIK